MNAHLTRRQQQIAALIVQGLFNKEIAASLNISEQTVKNHILAICDRTGCRTRVDIAVLFARAGLSRVKSHKERSYEPFPNARRHTPGLARRFFRALVRL